MGTILRFFAVWLVMGLAQQPTVRHYWKTTSCDIYGCDFIKNTLSVNAFGRISSHLRWPDPKHTPNEEKVLGLEKRLNENFKKYWKLSRLVVVDEIMLLFKGRFKYRQHVRGKPKATGLKLLAIADSESYLWDFYLYRGKSMSIVKIVLTLVLTIPFVFGFLVIADSYFGGLELAFILALLGVRYILACKTDRPGFLFDPKKKKKNVPGPTLLEPRLKQNEWRQAFREVTDWSEVLPNVLPAINPTAAKYFDPTVPTPPEEVNVQIAATSWHDRKVVNFLHNACLTGEEQHKNRSVPLVSRTYNMHMGAVDFFFVFFFPSPE